MNQQNIQRNVHQTPLGVGLPTGSKTLLFGIHQFLLHPLMVAGAWTALYGLPIDPRLWLCFLLHDVGYWGRHTLDDAEGERHPELGARLIARLLDPQAPAPGALALDRDGRARPFEEGELREGEVALGRWGQFCIAHSRSLARRLGLEPSALCVADKYAIAIEPGWLHALRASLSGEIHEYLGERLSENSKYEREERERFTFSLHDLQAAGASPWQLKLAWHAMMADAVDAWVANQPGHRRSRRVENGDNPRTQAFCRRFQQLCGRARPGTEG